MASASPTELDGSLVVGDSVESWAAGGTIEHRDPSTGRVQGDFPVAAPADVDRAVRAAAGAGSAWRDLPVDERAGWVKALGDMLVAHEDEFRTIAALECGTPAALGGVSGRWWDYYAGWADKIEGRVLPTLTGGGLDYAVYEPYGVVAAITPFNAPLTTIGMKVAPALAAGNTVVIKPSELTPFAASRFARLALDAGLPPGVVNVVQGGPPTSEALVSHPDVRKVSFTGGGATAAKVMAAAGVHIKPVAMELGGKSANMIFPDADLEKAVPFACYFPLAVLSGQNCQRTSRMLVHRDIYDDVLRRVVEITESYTVGPALAPDTTMGPLITERAASHVVRTVEDAVSSGQGLLVTGGKRLGAELAEGYFVAPAVIEVADYSAPIAQEEIFGPVVTLTRFSDEDEAVKIANSTPYGLAAHVQTADIGRAHRMARRLTAGTVHVNGFSGMPPWAPFGGYGASGFGREGGWWGIEEYLQVKNVYLNV